MEKSNYIILGGNPSRDFIQKTAKILISESGKLDGSHTVRYSVVNDKNILAEAILNVERKGGSLIAAIGTAPDHLDDLMKAHPIIKGKLIIELSEQ